MENVKSKARLHSRATASYRREIVTGKITMISEKGINLKTKMGTRFFNWNQVLNVLDDK